MVLSRQGQDPLKEMETLTNRQNLLAVQDTVEQTYISEEIVSYVVALIHGTRNSDLLLRGASPRATLSVVSMAKAIAQLRGRDYVVPRDVQEVLLPTLTHRLLLSPKAEGQGLTAQQVLQTLIAGVPAPKVR